MRNHASQDYSSILIVFFLSGVLFTAHPVQAEHIVLTEDGQGHLVYINIADPQPAPESHRFRTLHPPYHSPSQPPEKISRWVEQAAQRFQLDPRLVDAVIQVESGYNPRAASPKGALGLMQLIPATAQRFGVENPWTPNRIFRAESATCGISWTSSKGTCRSPWRLITQANILCCGMAASRRFRKLWITSRKSHHFMKVLVQQRRGTPLNLHRSHGKLSIIMWTPKA